MESKPNKKVRPIAKMDDETLLKHMNARHKGAAGISHFGKSNVPDDREERLLRTMHETLHTRELYKGEQNHEHTSYQTPEQIREEKK